MPSPRGKGLRPRSSGRHVSQHILAKRPKIRKDIFDRAKSRRAEGKGSKTKLLNDQRLEWSQGLYGSKVGLAVSKHERVSSVLVKTLENEIGNRFKLIPTHAEVKRGKFTGKMLPDQWTDRKTGKVVSKRAVLSARVWAKKRLEDKLLGRVYGLEPKDLKKLRKTPQVRQAMLIECYKGPGGS